MRFAQESDIERATVMTEYGAIEYFTSGTGRPVLVSHGIFQGGEGALRVTRDLVGGARVIAPCRFGYLGSAIPGGASAALQADAFAALLDRLGVDLADVLGISAGTSAAVQLGLRHPRRVSHLIISSGSFPGSRTAVAPPRWARLFYSDVAMRLARRLAPPLLRRLMGVPGGFPKDAEQRRAVEEMSDSLFPIRSRVAGAVFDAYVSNPEIVSCPLEEISVPALIIHARDDPLASYAAAVAAHRRIPGARLVSLDSGGHLQLGQAARVRAEIDAFLRAPASASTGRPAGDV